jgi:hypothetical protein
MDQLAALTIQQPWIEMILSGQKTIELRSWPITRRGLVALHAGWKVDWKAAALFGYDRPLELPRGVIVGRVEIVDALELDRESWLRLVKDHLVVHPLTAGIHAAFLGKADRLHTPIRFRGRPGFYTLPPLIIEEIHRQLSCSTSIPDC